MAIAIFFMMASIVLVIFLPIYIRAKNKMYNHNIKEKITLKRNIKNVWGIERIKDNVLTINNKCSIIIELGSIEYRLLNEKEQDNIDNNLIKIAKTFTYQTQFFSTIEKIDTTDKILNIKENIEKQKNKYVKEYGSSIIEYLNNIMQEENLYVRKNYLVVTSDEPFEKATLELKEFYDDLKYSFASIKVPIKLLDDMDIVELIYRELNKNANENLKNIINGGGLDFYVKAKGKA